MLEEVLFSTQLQGLKDAEVDFSFVAQSFAHCFLHILCTSVAHLVSIPDTLLFFFYFSSSASFFAHIYFNDVEDCVYVRNNH